MKRENYDWMLIGCHPVSEIAAAYFTGYSTKSAALRTLRKQLVLCEDLMRELVAAGYSITDKSFTPPAY